jgi:hypothetical protein
VLSAVNDLNSPVSLVPSEMPGVFLGKEGSAYELPGVEAHDVAVISEPQEWIWVVLNLNLPK